MKFREVAWKFMKTGQNKVNNVRNGQKLPKTHKRDFPIIAFSQVSKIIKFKLFDWIFCRFVADFDIIVNSLFSRRNFLKIKPDPFIRFIMIVFMEPF